MSTVFLEESQAQSQSTPVTNPDTILFIEIDNTLVATDTFLESLIFLLRKNILFLFLIPFWALQGKTRLYDHIAKRITLDVGHLPYRQHALDFLRNEALRGSQLVLLSGWNPKIAQDIVLHLSLFSSITERNNIHTFSDTNDFDQEDDSLLRKTFSYMCDRVPKNHNWTLLQRVILVGSHTLGLHEISSRGEIQVLQPKTFQTIPVLLKAFRVHQWVKNALLFLPLATAHGLFHFDLLFQVCLGFFAFSFCASGLYIFNDLLDLSADRRHPKKRFRPFASGNLSIKTGLWLQPLLFCSAFSIALLFLPTLFTILLIGYAFTTVFYSTYLKKIAILDVLVLTGFYTLRILAGGVAVGVPISAWLLAFSVFFFLSLAFGKRYAELQFRKVDKFQGVERRAYVGADKEIIGMMGTISGYLSVLVFALYINSHEVSSIYRNPEFLWFICPVLLYWISRTWLLAHRGALDDDPLLVALKDPKSYVVGILAILLAFLAV